MLQSIRSKATGVITWTIVSLIILAFSLAGLNYFLSGRGNSVVAAKVDGTEISWHAIERIYQNVYRQYSQRPDFNPDSMDPKKVKTEIRNSLIKQTSLLNFAEKNGFRVGKDHLLQVMKSIPEFQKEGRFSKEIYLAALRHAGITESSFQNNLKKDILLSQLQSGVGISSFSTEKEKEQIVKLLTQKRNFGYVIVNHEDYLDAANISKKEMEDYYAKHKHNFMTDEKVELQYVELSLDSVQKDVDVEDADLRAYYKKRASQFVTPEKVKVSHILIQASKNSDKDKSGEARLKANDILAKIKVDSEKFEDLVKQYSEDVASKKVGGSIGWIKRGDINENFEDLAFATDVGEVASDVVQTDFGFHIIKVADKKEAVESTFENVKEELIDTYKKEQALDILHQKSEDLANYAFEYPDSLAHTAKSLGLEIKTMKPFSKKGLKTGIESVKKVITAGFSEEVLNEHHNSELIKINEDRYVVVRLNKHIKSEQKPFDLVQDEIKSKLIKRYAKKQTIKKGNDLLAKIKNGNNPSAEALEQNLKWEIVKNAPRGLNKLHYVIMKEVFSLPRYAKDSKDKITGLILPNGDYAIVALAKVIDGKIEENERFSLEELEKSYSNHIGITFGRYENNLYQDSILKSTKISLNEHQ